MNGFWMNLIDAALVLLGVAAAVWITGELDAD